METAMHHRLKFILRLARQQDWSNKVFSLQKAQVCAELAALVYEEVQEYELKKASRIHLFASDSYRNLIKSRTTNSILDSLSTPELEASFFNVRSRHALILGTMFNHVVILTIRGTVLCELWDWKANIDTEKLYVRSSLNPHPFDFGHIEFDDQFFHRGFFESIIPQFASIADQIKQRINGGNNLKVIWTGHSLGGAMAAVAYAIHSSHKAHISLSDQIPGNAVSAYTFGMPRYCGLGIICGFSGPHHIYRKEDVVPTVPFRNMGFCDSSREYEITEAGLVQLAGRNDTFGFAGHVPRLLSSIKAHSIEGYAGLLARATGITRPWLSLMRR